MPAEVEAAPSFSNCFIIANCCRSDIGVRGCPDVVTAGDHEDDGDGEAATESSIWVSGGVSQIPKRDGMLYLRHALTSLLRSPPMSWAERREHVGGKLKLVLFLSHKWSDTDRPSDRAIGLPPEGRRIRQHRQKGLAREAKTRQLGLFLGFLMLAS